MVEKNSVRVGHRRGVQLSYAKERRQAPRVTTSIPVRLNARGRTIEAEICDLSRVGIRVRISFPALELEPGCDMGDMCKTVAMVLGDKVAADLNHPTLGNLVRRVLRIVRVGRPSDGPAAVDIGCTLRVPLTDEEVDAIGVTLPERHLPEGVYAAHEAFDRLNARRRDSAGAEFKTMNAVAFLSPRAGFDGVPMRATDVACTPTGVVLRFGSRRGAALRLERRDAGELFDRFIRDYGLDPSLLILEDQEQLWSGPVRLRAVEVDTDRDEAYLEFESETPIAG